MKDIEHWPADLQEQVHDFLDQLQADEGSPIHDPCCDNWRFARTDQPDEVDLYEEQRMSGCCGFFDTTETFNDVNVMIGFNYGH